MDKLEAAGHLSHLDGCLRHEYGYDQEDYQACALGSRALVRLDSFMEHGDTVRLALESALGGWETTQERLADLDTSYSRFVDAKVEALRSALLALERLEELS